MNYGTERFHRLEEEKQQVVLAAIEQQFIRHGYDAASTNEAARMSGISKGALFSYFPTKDTMFLAVLERSLRGAEKHFVDLDADSTDGVQGFELIVRVFDMIDHVAKDAPSLVRMYRVWANVQSASFEVVLRPELAAISQVMKRFVIYPLDALCRNHSLTAQDGFRYASQRLGEELLIQYANELVLTIGRGADKESIAWLRSVSIAMISAVFVD
jgi:AcrR family transcriptional regulator